MGYCVLVDGVLVGSKDCLFIEVGAKSWFMDRVVSSQEDVVVVLY